MIGLDTNVLVRFITQDDPKQSAVASAFLERLSADAPGFVTSVVLTEVTWVLSRAYKASRDECAGTVERLLRATELVVENSEAAYRALARYRNGTSVDFADALIAETCLLAGVTETVTFDRRAAQEAGIRLLA